MSDDEAASALSEKIIVNSLLCGKQLAGDSPDAMYVAIEFCFVFMHVVDRIAFAIVGHPRRSGFIDNLQTKVLIRFATSAATDEGKSHIREMVRSLYNTFSERSEEYGKCAAIYPETGQAMGSTVLWEFAEHAAAALGHPNDRVVIVQAMQLAVTALGLIDAASTINRLSR